MQNSFLSHTDTAQLNRNSVLRYVKEYGPISRTDIWKKMKISRASVTQIIRQLEETALIAEIGEGESSGGRKPKYLIFNGKTKKMFAFDWMSQALCLMNLDGDILFEETVTFESGIRPEDFAEKLGEKIKEMMSLELYAQEDILGLGMTLPGLIDSRSATVIYSVELGWQQVQMEPLFFKLFGQKLFLERTGNAMVLGEYAFGQFKGTSHIHLFILSDRGIGVSAIVHGDCQHGAHFMYGELGHVKLQEDTPCSCGQRGCLEAVIRELFTQSRGRITPQILEYLAIGVSTALNISDAQIAVLTGSYVEVMTAAQQSYLADLIRKKVTGQHLRSIQISFLNNGKHLALRGICANVFDCCYPVF